MLKMASGPCEGLGMIMLERSDELFLEAAQKPVKDYAFGGAFKT